MNGRSAPNSLWYRTGSADCDGCGHRFGLWDLVNDGNGCYCRECADKRKIETVSLPKYNDEP